VADKNKDNDAANENPYLSVPPIEPTPTTPKKRAAPRSENTPASQPIPPMVDLTGHGGEAPPRPDSPAASSPSARPDPYASAPAYPVNPYTQSPSGYVYGGTPAAVRPQGLAIASMVLGIASIVLCCIGGLFLGIPAVVMGHIAKRTQPWARGFWLTGLITGYVGVGLGVLYVVYYVVIFALSFAPYQSY
jgi:hypothetical protein